MSANNRKAIEQLNKRFNILKKYRLSYEAVWQDILDNCAPDLSGYINPKQLTSAGDREDSLIYDSTPQMACQECAAGVYSFTTPRSRRWFVNEMDEKTLSDSPNTRKWLDAKTDLDYRIMAASNYYDCKSTMKMHVVAVGTAVCVYYPDYDNVWRGEVLNIGEYWLGIDTKGHHDTLFREFTRTASQLVDEFGDGVPEKIKTEAQNSTNGASEYSVIHVICPNDKKLGAFPKKWLSAYYLSSGHDGEFLKISGFNFQPFEVSTWFRNRGEIYGKANPGRNTLPDMKQLQVMVYDFNEAVAKVNRPPMQGKADLLENGYLDTTPNAFNALSSMGTPDTFLKPLYALNPALKEMYDAIVAQQEKVKRGFYIDKFQIVSMRIDKTMTATEINRLAGEALQSLSPISENLNSEEFDPDISILTQYEIEAGILPEPPEEIQGKSFQPQYVSALTQAQKQADINIVLEVVETAINWYNMTKDPAVMDSVDIPFALNYINRVRSAPAGLIRDAEQIAQIKAQRDQQMQAEQAMAAAQQMASTAKDASAANMDGNNLMAQLAQAAGGKQ